MSLFILDTDHVSLHQRKDPLVTARIENCPNEELAVTVVTVGEQMRGRLAQLGQRKTIVTRNKRDFEQVPSLKIEDWSQ